MMAGWRVVFSNLRELLGQKPVGDTDERRPEVAVNQGDFAIGEPTDKDLLGLGDRSKDFVDVMALRMCPPTALDRFSNDGLGEARRGSLG